MVSYLVSDCVSRCPNGCHRVLNSIYIYNKV